MFQPSKYQTDIFQWIEKQENRKTGQRHLVVAAGPGSGKTTTLVEAAKLIENKQNAIFLAFNKHIATELQERLPKGMTASTLHSLGLKAIMANVGKFPKIEGKYHRNLAQDWVMENQDKLQLTGEEWRDVVDEIVKLTKICQLTMTDPRNKTAVKKQVHHYGVEVENFDTAIAAIPQILQRIVDNAGNMIDFDDMVWLPASQGWKPRQYSVIMADEVQDFNACQRQLVKMLLKPNGYAVWVGDRKQALYGFAYASVDSIDEIIEETKADEVPLSICYRCPKSHVKLAASIFSHEGYKLEARHDAPEGVIKEIYDADIIDYVKPGDLILCRVNAPLVPLCFQLIREGISAKVKGRDIGANLITFIKKIEKNLNEGIDWDSPHASLHTWQEEQFKRLEKTIRDEDELAMKQADLEDRIETILAIWSGKQPRTMAEMIRTIENLFSDDGASVWLSTIHKAKGLEAEQVFIVKPSKMPHPMAKQNWAIRQEWNMKFVALTRAKQALYFAWEADEPGCPLNLAAA